MKILLLALFFSLNLYSQDIDYLKSQDTVYIIFKEITTPLGKATTTKLKKTELNTFIDRVFNNYYLTSLDTSYQTIVITSRIHKDNLVKLKRNKFLKERSRSIVDIDFIDSLGLRNFFIKCKS